MLKIFIASLFLVTAFGLNARADENGNKPTEKEWTFLLFLNGHNNLDDYGAFNINQMEEIGSTNELNMVVEWGSLANVKTKRLYIEKDNDKNTVTSTAVETLNTVDMGDYKKLVEFVDWGVKNYPARHYMIAIWNHGSGWHKLTRDNSRDISYDDNTNHHITTEELAVAMAESAKIIGHKVDVYGSDACLMAMVEVGAEMKDSVDYMVGSEETEPGYGWPYNTWMKRWTAKPNATPAEVSKYLSQEYVKAYDGGIYGNQDVTFSAMNLNNISSLVDAVKNLRASLVALPAADLAASKTAVNGATSYYYSDYKDLGVFVDKLESAKTSLNTKLLSNVKDNLKSVVVDSGATGYLSESQGVSIWLPTYKSDLTEYGDRYSKLKFNQSSDWLKYLNLIAE
jgi:hypothetical protein